MLASYPPGAPPLPGALREYMMRSDESGTEQAVQPAEPQEVQRSWLGQLAEHAADGSVQAAAGYVTVKALGKVFGGQDKGGGKPEPPSEQPPSQAE
jgi:hypothetical protein